MTYPLPTNTTSTYAGIMVWANTITNGWMGYGMLLIIASVVFLGTKRFGATTAKAALASILVTFICTSALTAIGVTSSTTFIIMAMLLFFSYIYTYHD